MSIASLIRVRRKSLGLTLLDVAKKVGVSEATVQRWETGSIKNMGQDKVIKLADALLLTPAELMGYDESSSSLDRQLSEVQFALMSEAEGLSDEDKKDVLDYIRFKKSQKKG
ncbi:MAG: helix-turn-helix transcriptional regulator [Oscillospiraceae bacterium]|jgi:transcriptional regulator with XRE-family HTH domain|nr:helix-turn-helix transcriptional regulator [Oscillospiraceae bacterium]